MPGHCCCESNVRAAFVLGIIFIILGIGNCLINDEDFHGYLYNNIRGIIGVLINVPLVYGAHTRNSTAILIWIISAIVECICLLISTILSVIDAINAKLVPGVVTIPLQTSGK